MSDVSAGAQELAEALYLRRLADAHLYDDFKGIEQMEKLVPLKLDDVFVNLKVAAERAAAEPELLRRLATAETDEREQLERHLTDLDVETFLKSQGQGEPQPIDRVLARAGGVVLLVTDLVKAIAEDTRDPLERWRIWSAIERASRDHPTRRPLGSLRSRFARIHVIPS